MSAGLSITFTARGETRPLALPGLRAAVRRLEWDLQGGPARAEFITQGEANAELAGRLLGCGACVFDERGRPAWWGFVAEVEQGGVLTSLEGLANRVTALYRDETPAVEIESPQRQTAWLDDLESQAAWGVRERMLRLGQARESEALAAAQAALARGAQPARRLLAQRQPPGQMLLRLRGWWSTLGWKFWSEPRGLEACPGGGALQNLGDSTLRTKLRQQFRVRSAQGWTAREVWLKAGRYGQPADTLLVDLHADQGGLPGALLAGGSIAPSGLNGDTGWTRAVLNAPVALTGNSLYVLVVSRSGGINSGGYYRLAVDESRPVDGSMGVWNGSLWTTRTPDADLPFVLTGEVETTRALADLLAPATAGQFLGGAVVRDASGVWGRQYRDGRADGLEEASALLAMGCASGSRLSAQVCPDRRVEIRAVPDAPPPAPELWIGRQGELLERDGSPALAGSPAVGRWARALAADPLDVLLESALWQAGRLVGRWHEADTI